MASSILLSPRARDSLEDVPEAKMSRLFDDLRTSLSQGEPEESRNLSGTGYKVYFSPVGYGIVYRQLTDAEQEMYFKGESKKARFVIVADVMLLEPVADLQGIEDSD